MPSSAVLTFTDPDLYFAGIRNLQIEGVVTRCGDFHAEATRIDLHRLWMHRFDESVPRIMRITPSGKRALILFTTHPNQAFMQVNGMDTPQNQIANFGLDWEYYLRSSAACEWATMSLAPEDLAVASEAITGRPLVPASFPHRVQPSAAEMSRLLQLHEKVGHLAKTAPDMLAKSEVAKAIEQALVEVMVLCLTKGYSANVRNVHRHRATVMQRLEQVFQTSPERSLCICRNSAQRSVLPIRRCATVARNISA
jgi:hypothetical protein